MRQKRSYQLRRRGSSSLKFALTSSAVTLRRRVSTAWPCKSPIHSSAPGIAKVYPVTKATLDSWESAWTAWRKLRTVAALLTSPTSTSTGTGKSSGSGNRSIFAVKMNAGLGSAPRGKMGPNQPPTSPVHTTLGKLILPPGWPFG